MPDKLTVLIPCKNERQNIAACIESVRGVADEVLVADSGSTDETLEIVRQLGGCRIIEREFIGYADFKNWAIPQAAHEWVLIVDADERVTPELADEIREGLRNPDPNVLGYWIYRRTFVLGREIKHGGWPRDKVFRLIRRDECRYVERRVHEEIEVEPARARSLKGKLLHYGCESFALMIAKMERYSLLGAQDYYARGRRSSYLMMLLVGPLRFLHLYVLKMGYLDGMIGLQVCALAGIGSFLKQARLWELEHAPAARELAARSTTERARAA